MTARRGWASGSPRPGETRRSDARPSFSRLAVWVARREIKIRGEPSTSVATLTKDPKGWPVLRSIVPNVPARVTRSKALATATASKSAAGAFSRRRPGMKPGRAALLSDWAINDVPVPVALAFAPIPPCLVTLPPLHGFSKAYGAGAGDACGRLMLEGRHADHRSRRRRPQYPHFD